MEIKLREDIDKYERFAETDIAEKLRDFASNMNEAIASELRVFMIRRGISLNKLLNNISVYQDIGERKVYYKDELILYVELEPELGKLPEIVMTCCYLRDDLCANK
jgi:hypothetical protein